MLGTDERTTNLRQSVIVNKMKLAGTSDCTNKNVLSNDIDSIMYRSVTAQNSLATTHICTSTYTVYQSRSKRTDAN